MASTATLFQMGFEATLDQLGPLWRSLPDRDMDDLFDDAAGATRQLFAERGYAPRGAALEALLEETIARLREEHQD